MKTYEIFIQELREMSMRNLMRTQNYYEKLIEEKKEFDEEEYKLLDDEIKRRVVISQFNKFLMDLL